MKQKMKKIYIGCTLFVLIVSLSIAVWLITRDNTTEGVKEANNLLGIEWYDKDGSEFTISTVEELYEFAELSTVYDFEGQTIYLGADIIVNEGNAADWGEEMPERMWDSIAGFSGTFDGQGHTISGLCSYGQLYTATHKKSQDFVTAGLFRNTSEECVIKNFKLLNSYFFSDFDYGCGSISSNGGGTFDSIYSDAIITSYKCFNGGIVGRARESVTITNCWFDGTINVVGGYGTFTAGILGNAEGIDNFKIEHCLFSGVINNDLYKKGVQMGGILGAAAKTEGNISDCLSTGNINCEWKAAVGSVMGNVRGEAFVTISDVYSTEETWTAPVGNVGGSLTGAPTAYKEHKLQGAGGYQWTTLDFENYWAVVDGGTPILKTFAVDAFSLEGVEKRIDVSWYDKNQDTYILYDAADFYGFAVLSSLDNFKGKTVKLGADITLNTGKISDWLKETPEYEWKCIGSNSNEFEGTFDGQMHTISGIYLSADESYNGLFGVIGKEATVKNFRLKNSYFETTANSFGSIAGRCRGKINTVYSNAIVVSSASNAGGLVGQVPGSANMSMTNCWFDGSVKNTGNNTASRSTGGLIGVVLCDSKITNCLNSGTIDVTAYTVTNSATSKGVNPYAGGLIGYVGNKSTATISYCMNVGEIKYNKAATSAYGSIIGRADNAIVRDVYATKESCKTAGAGNIKGAVTIYDKEQLNGYGGYQWTTLNYQKYWAVVPDDTSILRSFASRRPSLDGIAKMVDTSWYSENADTYVLYDVADLNGFVLLSKGETFEGKTVKLGADIAVNAGNAGDWSQSAPEYVWKCIGSVNSEFQGTFDGQMHTISGIYLKATEAYSGLFGIIGKQGVVKNFSLKNSYFETTANSFGSIAGRCRGVLDTVYSNAIVVSSASNVGGMIGQIPGSANVSVTNCWFDGSVTNTGNDVNSRMTGGLIGVQLSDAVISNCLNSGTIDASVYTVTNSATSKGVNPYVGGLIGNVTNKSTATISSCMNVGEIRYNKAATSTFGSILGRAENAIVKDTYATAESCKTAGAGTIKGTVAIYDKEQLSGYGGYRWTTLNFEKYWSVVMNDTSILRSFANENPSLNGVARMLDTSWYDEKASIYVLYDAADLNGFAMLSQSLDFAGKTVKLGANIEMNTGNAVDWAKTAPECMWRCIGSVNSEFHGTFDGQMHTISGIYLSTAETYSGLFGVIGKQGSVKNFSLKNSYFETTANSFGSIAGRCRGVLDTVYSNAIVVSSASNVGGMIGQIPGSANVSVTNCWFDGSVTNTGNDVNSRMTGGLIGTQLSDALVANCLNSGIIDATAYTAHNSATNLGVNPYVGGLIGNAANTSTTTISNCMNVGEIKYNAAATNTFGSLVGRADQAIVNDTYVTAESCKTAGAGVITGMVVSYKETKLKGYGGHQWTTLDFEEYWAAISEDTPVLSSFVDKSLEINVDKMVDISWYDAQKDTYTLSDKQDLYGFVLLSRSNSFAGKTIKLDRDITINEGNSDDWDETAPEYEWMYIGSDSYPFAGTFDGDMHEISGVYYVADGNQQGLFKRTASGAVLQNFKLVNSYFKTRYNAFGSIVGRATGGEFYNIYCDADVQSTGDVMASGMIGQVYNNSESVIVDHCWFAGSVTSNKEHVGGIIGRINGPAELRNCLNSGDITSAATANVGGLVGSIGSASTSATIKYCLSVGTVECIGGNDINPTINCTYKTTDASCKGTGLSNVSKLFLEKTEEGKYKNDWVITSDGAPALKLFAEYAGKKYQEVNLNWYDGSGSYTLKDEADFYGFALLSQTWNFANETITLADDITINEGSPYGEDGKDADDAQNPNDWDKVAPDFVWLSIGVDADDRRFAGTFDGNNKTISGIYLSVKEQRKGLFGATSGAFIKNFKLVNSYFRSTTQYLGSIVGRADNSTLDSIYSKAIVSANGMAIGGLVGHTYSTSSATINNCWFAGEVECTGNSQRVGGIIAQGQVTMKNCLNTGTVTSNYNNGSGPIVGGLIGLVVGNSSIKYCLNNGAVKYVTTETSGFGSLIGGLNSGAACEIENTYAVKGTCVNISDNTTVLGNGETTDLKAEEIKGVNALTKIPNLFKHQTGEGKYKNYWTITADGAPVLESFAEFAGKTYMGVDLSWYNGSKNYILSDEADFYGFALLSRTYNFKDDMITLAANITLNEGTPYGEDGEKDADDEEKPDDWSKVAPDFGWLSIGSDAYPFAGTFDGGMKTISGVYLMARANRQGLFALTTTNAVVKNFKLVNSYFTTTNNALGSVVGRAAGGAFSNIYSDAIVVNNSDNITGGLIGQVHANSERVTVDNCWFAGTVTSDEEHIGGILGRINGPATITNCLNTGEITSSSTESTPYVGGLCGSTGTTSDATIKYCLNVGKVNYNTENATTGYGSILGCADKATAIEHTYATTESCGVFATGSVTIDGAQSDWQVSKNNIKGTVKDTKDELKDLFNILYTTKWVAVEGKFPALKSFEEFATAE